jgi:hypothetical protein
MSSHDAQFENCLSALARALNLPELAFDEEGLCRLSVEGTHGVTLRRDDERACLVFAGLIGDFPEILHAALATDLLSLAVGPMLGHLPSLYYDDDMEMLAAYQLLPLASDPNPLLENAGGFFADFVDYLLSARRLLSQAIERLGHAETPDVPPDANLLRV